MKQPVKTKLFTMRVTEQELTAWKAIARGQGLATLIRNLLNGVK